MDDLYNMGTSALVAVFSLAWMLVGIALGKRLPAKEAPARQSRRSPRQSRGRGVEIYVGNLSYDISEKGLMKKFRQFGEVRSARLIQNRSNGKSKGYGFVEMSDRSEAEAAISALSGKDFQGRKLVVNEAKSKARAGE